MKVEEATIALGGQHSFDSENKVEVSSRCSFRAVLAGLADSQEVSPAASPERSPPSEKLRLMLEQLIAQLLAMISGDQSGKVVDLRSAAASEAGGGGTRAPSRSRELVWESRFTETVSEHERSEFSANGHIRTADGRALDFKLDLSLCRHYECTRTQSDNGKVVLRDPLVINFDGKAAELVDQRFDFDLDADGRSESLPGLATGSGFLALDRDGDGRIKDGRELFGALSGQGFADLAKLDADGNGWIDEADPAFAQLGVWSRDSGGKDSLRSLKEAGVGALYLGSVDTPFSLKDDGNRLRGEIRASGVYLREDGGAGSLQQIDLAV